MVRRRLSAPERRSRLLDSAQDLFAERGYRRAEMDEIARRAGVTKPIVYRHFPGGKSEIFRVVLEASMSDLVSSLWSAMGAVPEPKQRLYRGLNAYVEFAEENTEAFSLLVNASSELEPEIGELLRDVRGRIAGGLTNTIADVMKGAGLSPNGASVYSYALLGGVESAVSWWLEEKPMERASLVDYLLALVWRGFDGLPRDPARFHESSSTTPNSPTRGPLAVPSDDTSQIKKVGM